MKIEKQFIPIILTETPLQEILLENQKEGYKSMITPNEVKELETTFDNKARIDDEVANLFRVEK